MKSPLIVGSDVRALPAESLAILKNKALIAVNQDELAIQGTLRAASDTNVGSALPTVPATHINTPATAAVFNAGPNVGSPNVGRCTFGTASGEQQWQVLPGSAGSAGARLSTLDGKSCLTVGTTDVSVQPCGSAAAGSTQDIDMGRANVTVAQIRDSRNSSSCLAYDGSTLHMEACRVEVGDGVNATDCWIHNCRFSSLSDQLFYLNGLQQLSLAFTNFQAPAGDPPRANVAENVPMCLMARGGSQPDRTAPPPPPAVNHSQPLQVWAGPLTGGDVAVVLLNIGDSSASITAHWADIGLKDGAHVTATDLWTGASVATGHDSITATVATHDVAVFRLSPA
jgi:hypothetical protein